MKTFGAGRTPVGVRARFVDPKVLFSNRIEETGEPREAATSPSALTSGFPSIDAITHSRHSYIADVERSHPHRAPRYGRRCSRRACARAKLAAGLTRH